MIFLKPTAIRLLFATQLICSAGAMADTTNPQNTGTIILRSKDNAICTLQLPPPGESKKYDLSKQGGECGTNISRSIQFAEMPSATKILLTDLPECVINPNDEFRIELKTTKKQTSTSIIEIEYLTTFRPGTIIEPGLQLTDVLLKPGATARDKVDCVMITTSSPPPLP